MTDNQKNTAGKKSGSFWKELWQPPRFVGYKIASVIAALVVWGFVMITQNPMTDTLYTVPLEARNLSADLAMLDTTNQVQVRVQGSSSELTASGSGAISAYIDLADVREGSTTLEVKVILPNGVQLVSVTPSTVDVTLEALSSADFPLDVDITGDPASGYAAFDAVATPDNVTLFGAEKYLNSVNKVCVSASVEGLDANYNKKLQIQVFDELGNNITEHFTISPSCAEVMIPLIADMPEKNVSVNASVVGEPASGYKVGRIVVEPSTIRVFGDVNKLNNLYYLETVPIDISGMSKTYSQKVEVVAANGLTLPVNTVTVVVQIEPSGSASVTRSVIYAQNLAAGLTCEMPSVKIKLDMAGPDEALAAVSANEIVPYVDCGDITEPGEYTLPVHATLPDNISLVSAAPQQITVKVVEAGD